MASSPLALPTIPALRCSHQRRYPVLVETGRELLAGSTRMKAGTAQKVVLNLISTGIMLRLGRVYRGMMVNMQTTKHEVEAPCRGDGCSHCRLQPSGRRCALEQTEGDIKMATLVVLGYDKAEAESILAKLTAICVACLPISLRIVTEHPKERRRQARRSF